MVATNDIVAYVVKVTGVVVVVTKAMTTNMVLDVNMIMIIN